ncbi:MAG: WD40 repeat domain-containing protein [Acidimicrobiales bacterium]
MQFDKTGQLYSGGYDGRVIAWDVDVEKPRWIREHDGLVNALAISSISVFSAGADREVRCWDKDTGETIDIPTLKCPEDINVLKLSRNEHLLATASDDGVLRVFDIDAGELVWARACSPWGRYGESIESLDLLKTAGEWLLVAVDNSGNVLIVDFEGKVLATTSLHSLSQEQVPDIDTCTVSSERQTLLCGSADGRLLELELNLEQSANSWQLHTSSIKAIAVSGSLIATTGYDNQLRVAPVDQPSAGLAVSLLDGPNWGWARGLEFSPVKPNLLAGTSLFGRPQIWETDPPQLHQDRSPLTFGLNACEAFRGRVFVGGDNGYLWAVDRMQTVTQLVRLDSMILGIVSHPTKFFLAVVTHCGSVYLVDSGTGSVIACLVGDRDPATACAFSTEGTALAVGYYSGAVRCYSVPDLGTVAETTETDTVKALVSVPQTNEFAIGTADGGICLRGCQDLLLRAQEVDLFLINDVTWVPSRQRLISVGRDQLVREWDLDLKLQDVRSGHLRSIKCVAASPEGGKVASGGYDGAVEFFCNGVVQRSVHHSLPGVAAIGWLDSANVVSAGWDGTVCVVAAEGNVLSRVSVTPRSSCA